MSPFYGEWREKDVLEGKETSLLWQNEFVLVHSAVMLA